VAADLTIRLDSENESGVSKIVGGEAQSLRKIDISIDLQHPILEVSGGSFELVGTAKCRARSRRRRGCRRLGAVSRESTGLLTVGRESTGLLTVCRESTGLLTVGRESAGLRIVAGVAIARGGVIVVAEAGRTTSNDGAGFRDGQCSDWCLVDDVRISDFGV
jgi:hypothetical protein